MAHEDDPAAQASILEFRPAARERGPARRSVTLVFSYDDFLRVFELYASVSRRSFETLDDALELLELLLGGICGSLDPGLSEDLKATMRRVLDDPV